MNIGNFIHSLLTNLIPQKLEVGQNFYYEIHDVQKANISLYTRWISTNEDSKFKTVYHLKIVKYH